MSTKFGRRVAKSYIVIVVQSIDSINFTANIELASCMMEILDGRVLRVTTENLSSFFFSVIALLEAVENRRQS